MEGTAPKLPNKIPWKDEINRTMWYTTYRETDEQGNILRYIFLLRDKNGNGISYAMHGCQQLASALMSMDNWSGYVIQMPIGSAAGQEVDHMYLEIKPVR